MIGLEHGPAIAREANYIIMPLAIVSLAALVMVTRLPIARLPVPGERAQPMLAMLAVSAAALVVVAFSVRSLWFVVATAAWTASLVVLMVRLRRARSAR